jgi:peptidylprolyl isomerase
VVAGIELLSALPRGPAPMGFYTRAADRTPILRIRLAADVPERERSHLELLRTDTATFRSLVETRRNRKEAWFKNTAGHIDVCNVPLPVRTIGKP